MMLRGSAALSLLAAIGLLAGHVRAFRASPAAPPRKSSALYMGPPRDPTAPITELFGEGSRKYRRTVYTHDQWVTHRSPERFTKNLGTLFNSGIYRSIGGEVLITSSVAIFVWVWNLLVGGYQDLGGTMHDPLIVENWAMMIGLPLTTFTTLSSSLGLLLGKRSADCIDAR
jgi:hypothetical protein